MPARAGGSLAEDMLEGEPSTGSRRRAFPLVGAFFDVDNTLHPGPSIEERFFFHLWAKRLIGFRELLQSLAFLIRHVPPITRQPLREYKLYLNGKEASVIQPIAKVFVETSILPRVSPDAIEAVEHHRRQGHRLVLVTASLDFLVAPLAEWLRIDTLVAARAERHDGRYTGRLLPPFPYGEGKRVVVEQYARHHDIDLAQSYFYGDSPGDRDVLSAVGHPRVVNPIRGMGRLARERGWPIVKWK